MKNNNIFTNPIKVSTAITDALEIHVARTRDSLTSYINDNNITIGEYACKIAFTQLDDDSTEIVHDTLDLPADILTAIFEVASFNLGVMCDYEVACIMCAYYRTEEDDFNRDILELDSWNGVLQDDRYYDMWEFDDLNSGKTPTEIVEMLTDNFNINDNYFKYTIWGVESTEWLDYSDYLDTSNCGDILDNESRLDLCDYITELIDEYHTAKEA